ncbi:MAG: hypothetical protein ACHQ5A_06220 [Opitutales bacterium]
MSALSETRAAPPPGRRTRLALGLAAWLWLAGLISLLLLLQALHVRTRALLFFAGLLLLIRLLGWAKSWLGNGL